MEMTSIYVGKSAPGRFVLQSFHKIG